MSWFTSFGYFDDIQNRSVLDEVRRCLRRGGQFLVELNHRDGLLSVWRPADVVRQPDGMMVDERVFDPITGRANTVRTVVRNGAMRQVRYFVRLFSFTELHGWLLDSGFSEVEGFTRDSGTLAPSATRMIVIAHV